MEWLEIIKVQGNVSGYHGADTELLRQLAEDMNIPGLKGVKVYTNAALPNDLMITLAWSKDHPRSRESELAQGLILELKRHGLVDHSVWNERLTEELL